jgi:hypothetical protein
MSTHQEEALNRMADDWDRDHDELTARAERAEQENERLREEITEALALLRHGHIEAASQTLSEAKGER